MNGPLGVVAAGHPVSADAGAQMLRGGGNAVDAALGAMLAAFACEPLLTGLGAGGYMLVVAPERPPVLLDFFVEAPGRGRSDPPGPLIPVEVSFGDALQVFHVGAASVGTYGMPAGVCEAARRFARLDLSTLAAPAIALARDGVALNDKQAYILELLAGIVTSTAEAAALFAPGGRLLGAGDTLRQPELADALARLARDGATPFYTGDIGTAIREWLAARGGLLTAADLRAYAVIDRAPLEVVYRGRRVLTNPPPSAGGILIARALAALDRTPGPPDATGVVAVMADADAARTPAFLAGLEDPGFAERFLAGPLGSTTHVSALDRDGWACAVTCSAGSASGVIVPGTGVHLNNMLGEQDLNPLGFHRHAPGLRMPSMMSPTVVLRDGVAELAVGSAGSNRIRSAVLQTIVRCVDEALPAQQAVDAPRVHYEGETVFAEPGIDVAALRRAGRTVSSFRARNLFFGGAQAAVRTADGTFSGGGDPRRGGAAVVVA